MHLFYCHNSWHNCGGLLSFPQACHGISEGADILMDIYVCGDGIVRVCSGFPNSRLLFAAVTAVKAVVGQLGFAFFTNHEITPLTNREKSDILWIDHYTFLQ